MLFPASHDGKTCFTCSHRERWECGGRIIQYCGAIKSNRTENGKLKIKCKKPACGLYEGTDE
jgi:hypothetical protein